MPSLWTDEDPGAHPWIAAHPHGGGVAPPAAAAALRDDEPAPPGFLSRPAVLATACAAAAVAGALIEVLR